MKYILLYNPVSGKRKFHKQIPFIQKYFEEKELSLDVYCSKEPKDLLDKAAKISSDYDVILVSGGDGTVNEVLNGIMSTEFRPAMATIPSGTANDVASLLGFNKNIKRSLDIITTTEPISMDVNKINDHYFLYAAAAGILTKISYEVQRANVRRYGYLAYVSEGAKDIFKNYKMNMNIKHMSGSLEGDFMLVLALSSRRVAGVFLRSFADSKLDDGLLEMRLIKSIKRLKILKLAIFFLSGGSQRGKDIQLKSDTYSIKTTDDIVWNTDGEKADQGNINITVLKQELKVFASDKSKKKFFTQ